MNPFWRNKKVFLTGHTGFKGAWLCLQLENLGAEVTGYALAPATEPNLFTLAKVDKRINSKIGDVRDLESLKKAYKECEPDVVFHMAAQALVRPSYVDPVGTYATNVMGAVHLLESARLIPSAQAVINVTSDKCYENLEREAGYREDEPMGGYDPYSNSKGCSELVTSAYRKSFHLKLASGRAGNVVGGGDWSEDRLVPDSLKALELGKTIQVRNPNSIRPWQHVLEPLSGYVLLAEKLVEQPGKFAKGWNFGPSEADAKPVSWIADRLVAEWGLGAKWEHNQMTNAPHEAHYLKLDCTKARDILGWKPRLELEQTVHWIVDWHKRYLGGEAVDSIFLSQIEKYLSL